MRQGESDRDLVEFVRHDSDAAPLSILMQDPWSKARDLDPTLAKPLDMVLIGDNINYLLGSQSFSIFTLKSLRMNSVSYLKIIAGIDAKVSVVRDILNATNVDPARDLAQLTKWVVISAYDDEGWIGARVGPCHSGA